MNELQTRLEQVTSELRARDLKTEEHPSIVKLNDLSAMHGQALNRLEALAAQPRPLPVPPVELSGLALRTDARELRVESLEQGSGECALASKADRVEVLRLDASLREISEPV